MEIRGTFTSFKDPMNMTSGPLPKSRTQLYNGAWHVANQFDTRIVAEAAALPHGNRTITEATMEPWPVYLPLKRHTGFDHSVGDDFQADLVSPPHVGKEDVSQYSSSQIQMWTKFVTLDASQGEQRKWMYVAMAGGSVCALLCLCECIAALVELPEEGASSVDQTSSVGSESVLSADSLQQYRRQTRAAIRGVFNGF